jgi:hypothetical protein
LQPRRGVASFPRQLIDMAKTRIVVFGHSHMDALLDAYSHRSLKEHLGIEIIFYRLMRKEHSFYIHGKSEYNVELDERELRSLIQEVRPALVVGMLEGQQTALLGMVGPERPFEFCFPGEERHFEPSQEIVPYDMLLETCQEELIGISRCLKDLRPVMTMPALALCPPPPTPDAEFILAHFPPEVAQSMRQRGIPPAAWRLRIWKLCVLALQAVHREHRMECLSPPPQSHDEEGFLLPSFWSDGIHANAEYGRLLIGQIERAVTAAYPER